VVDPGTYGLKVRYSAIELRPLGAARAREKPPHEAYRLRRLQRSSVMP
jgi:hypothetical protein